ncbi:MAG: hypothetical protein MZV64_24380 [Ignavibacteriales bacterium]|nr:hypothetical protein [Ignavibacteriales bacterium]
MLWASGASPAGLVGSASASFVGSFALGPSVIAPLLTAPLKAPGSLARAVVFAVRVVVRVRCGGLIDGTSPAEGRAAAPAWPVERSSP